ncbi:MAG: DNA polymerase III subunit delta [Geminicoccaceae bacterium]
MKIAAGQVDRFLKAPNPNAPVVLIYGPDEGLVRERVDLLIKSVLDDPKDPFRLSDLAADQVRSDPALLADEARALCLMGGRRVVRVRQAGDALRVAAKSLLALEVIDALVLIEAGELGAGSSLRKLVEQAPNAAALPCYRDEGRDLSSLIDRLLAERELRVDAEARAYLIEHLGGDRGVTRAELDKLAIYVGRDRRGKEIGLDEVAAVVGDSAAVGLDDLAHATTLGDVAMVERCLNRLLGEGQAPVRLIRTMINHVTRLRRLSLMIDQGDSIDRAIGKARPPIHFRRKGDVKSALRNWSGVGLGAAQARLLEAEIACKTTGRPSILLCRETIFTICQDGRARAPTRR